MVSGVGFRLGVDFGTTNTVAALAWPDGAIRPLIFDGSPTLPSAVYRGTDGILLAGRDALHGGRVRPESLEPNPKRCVDDTAVLLGSVEVPVRELVAAVLRRVAAEASRVAGAGPDDVVLTCPATWGARRRQVLLDAATDAGLAPARLVAEPVAAAAWFASTGGVAVPVGGCIVVYDFGAGTFDASAVRRDADGFTVLAEEGLRETGGLDVDAAVVSYLGAVLATRDPQAWQRLSSPASAQDLRLRRTLWDDVRTAKETLSRAASTELHVPIVEDVVVLGREQLEQLARPLVERTVATTAAVIRAAGLTPPDVTALFLVGGSSRLPLAATMLHQRLRLAPTVLEQPELVVAQGSLCVPPPAGRTAAPTAALPPVVLSPVPPDARHPLATATAPDPSPPPAALDPRPPAAADARSPAATPDTRSPVGAAPDARSPVAAPDTRPPVADAEARSQGTAEFVAAPISGGPPPPEPSAVWPVGSERTDPVPSQVSPAPPPGAPAAPRAFEPAVADRPPAGEAPAGSGGPPVPLDPVPLDPGPRLGRRVLAAVIGLLLIAGVAYALKPDGDKPSDKAQEAAGAGCAPVPGEGLVVLSDDRHLLRADNIVPVMQSIGQVPAVLQQVNLVSAALDTRKLAAVNRRLEVDHAAPADVAQEFAVANGLTKPVWVKYTWAVTVGTTAAPEQQVLAHLYRIALQAAGFTTTVQVRADRAALHAALLTTTGGGVHLVPEYAGTYAAFLNDAGDGLPNRFATPDFNASTLAFLGGKLGLTFGTQSPAAAQDVFAVSKPFAAKHRVASLDDFARACSGTATVVAGSADCPPGYPCRESLADLYKLRAGTHTVLPDRGPAARAALAQGTASLALISSSDPAFA
jgi:glycine betaine/choline ABC-type transport system substrate-binding protein